MAYNSNLEQAMNSISLEDEEEGVFELENEVLGENTPLAQGFNAKLCVVGRFITEGRVDFAAMQHSLAALWKPGKGVYMKELDANLFLFQFYHEVDVKRVMDGCPWSFNRKALVMSRMKEGQNPRCVELNSIDLWVQVHDLNVGFMSEKVLKGIDNYIGSFVESCPSNFVGVWREYMRIRITINLSKPLKRRMKMKMTGNEWFWVNFKYENVPSFCFICGIIGHSERFCSQLFEKQEHEIVKPYGSWMRAPLKRQVKPIGAKWLRNGNEDSSSSSVHGDRHKQLGEEDANHDPKSTPENMTAVGQGENQGDMVFQNLNQGAGISENTFQTNTATSAVNKDKEDTVIIELKKRKTDDGFDASSSMGQHRDIIMGLEDEFTNGMEHADAGNNKDPKNLYGAGTQGGTRLAL